LLQPSKPPSSLQYPKRRRCRARNGASRRSVDHAPRVTITPTARAPSQIQPLAKKNQKPSTESRRSDETLRPVALRILVPAGFGVILFMLISFRSAVRQAAMFFASSSPSASHTDLQ